MISYGQQQKQAAMRVWLGRAALRVLFSATIPAFMASCSGTEPTAPPSPPATPDLADPDPLGDGPRQLDIKVEYTGPEWAIREMKRMEKLMDETKPGGCDPPPLLSSGHCDGVGTCDTHPFLAESTTSIVSVNVTPPGTVPPGMEEAFFNAELNVELIQCGATASTIMSRSQNFMKTMLGGLAFSAATQPKGKYLLRISSKVPGLHVSARYDVSPPEGPCEDVPPASPR